MKSVFVIGAVGFLGVALAAAGAALGDGDAKGDAGASSRGAIGPDIIVGDLPNLARWGRSSALGITSYSVGTTACNIGDEPANWVRLTPAHPVILQNMYRLKDGRFEHVGIAWVKHGFTVIPEDLCGVCEVKSSPDLLFPGCSDTYSMNTNAVTSTLGPRAEVNAAKGTFPYPHSIPPMSTPQALRGRLLVRDADIHPPSNENARYFIEGHYIAADDAAAGNSHNNASHREIFVDWFGGESTTYNIDFVKGATTQVGSPAIMAWSDIDPEVEIVHADIPDDGRMTLGYKVSDNGDGTWRYEFALYNMDSDRSGRTFSLPVTEGVTVSNAGFHDVEYFSGDGLNGSFSGVDWPVEIDAGAITWSTDLQTSDPNANALRFGTLYNFRFDANAPPVPADVTVGLFKAPPMMGPGAGVTQIVIAAMGPGEPVFPCPSDINGDGQVNASDLGLLLGAWNFMGPDPSDINGDEIVNSSDLGLLLGAWGACS